MGLSVSSSEHYIKATVHSDRLYNNLVDNKSNSDKNVRINFLWLYRNAIWYDCDRSSLGGFKINKQRGIEFQIDVKTNFFNMDQFSHKGVWNNLALNIKNPLK